MDWFSLAKNLLFSEELKLSGFFVDIVQDFWREFLVSLDSFTWNFKNDCRFLNSLFHSAMSTVNFDLLIIKFRVWIDMLFVFTFMWIELY